MESQVITRAWTVYGWILAEISLRPKHPDWIEIIRAGPTPGHTLLGNPLQPLREEDARALSILQDLRFRDGGRNLQLALRIHNSGTAAWPVTPPTEYPTTLGLGASRGPADYCVEIEIEWRPHGEPEAEPLARQTLQLYQDVEPGDSFVFGAIVEVPDAELPLDLTIQPRQRHGARFTDPRNRPVRTTVR